MPDVTMPRLSDSMEEGRIIKWLKSDGDTVKQGDELVEIETDKANMTYEADVEGELQIVAGEGDTLAIGEVIARIGAGGDGAAAETEEEDEDGERQAEEKEPAEGEAAEPQAEEEDEEEQEPAEEEAAERQAEEEDEEEQDEEQPRRGAPARARQREGGDGDGRIKASPVARRMARELGVDLGGVEGSGPGGRIVKADVEALRGEGDGRGEEAGPEPQREAGEREKAVPPAPAAGDGGTAKGEVSQRELTRLQQAVARRMAESKATQPDFQLNAEVDMDAAWELREQLKAAAGEGETVPSFNDFVVKACALALREFPRANAAYKDGGWELYSRVNVGVAVAAEGSLVVPTVFDADRKAVGQIAREARALAERVRARAITPPELSGGTFTVSNLGMYGITSFSAVINPPQAAILAVGAIREVPVVRDGQIVPGRRMAITLTCDHRILYGAEAAEFLRRIMTLLEAPLALAL